MDAILVIIMLIPTLVMMLIGVIVLLISLFTIVALIYNAVLKWKNKER